MVVLAVVLSIIACIAVDYVMHWSAREGVVVAGGVQHADLLRVPGGVFFAPGHTWMRLERSGTLQLGAGQLPLRALGEVDAIETPPVGTQLRKGDPLAVLKHGKRELLLRCPVDGTVQSVRSEARKDPRSVQPGSLEESWLCRVQPSGLGAALREAFVAEEAREWMRHEAGRVRDFVSDLAARRPEACATLADGGLPLHGLADLVNAEQWQEFVTRFFDTDNEIDRRAC